MTIATRGTLKPSTEIAGDAAALRKRASEDGYLYLPGLIDREMVLDLRRQFVTILKDIGWLKPGTDPMDAIANRPATTEGKEDFWPVFDRFQKLEAFHALAHEPALIEVLDRVFGEKTFVHPRNIGRVMFPDTPTTPPHQDYLHIRGTENTWTGWIPMGDLPEVMGGLTVLPGFHTRGLLPVKSMPGAGGAGIEMENLGEDWLSTEYRAGDVLLLHSLTPHASLPNRTGERMRLSLDYRYQPMSEPVDYSSLIPHMRRFGWDTVYENWQSKRYQYYWQDLPLDIQDPHDLRNKPAGGAATGKY